jgi:hypothetical protein
MNIHKKSHFSKKFCRNPERVIDPLFRPPLKTLKKGGIREGGPPLLLYPLLIGGLPHNISSRRFTYGYQHFIHNGMWITLFVYSNFVLVYSLTLWEQTIRYEYYKNRTKRYTIRYRYLCP